MMKKKNALLGLTASVLLLSLTACHESIEDRAAREAKEYTEKFCPTPVKNGQRTDSMTFTKDTKTFNYYVTLSGQADNPVALEKNRKKITTLLQQGLHDDPGTKVYRDNGFRFRYILRSTKQSGKVLYDAVIK